jgi:hypothetical protein
MPDRSETVRLLNRSARVRFYLGQSSCLGYRAELAADRICAVPRTNWVQLHWKRGIRGVHLCELASPLLAAYSAKRFIVLPNVGLYAGRPAAQDDTGGL